MEVKVLERSVKVGTVRIDVSHPSPLDSATIKAKIAQGQVATKESKRKQAKQEKKSAGVKREAAKPKPEKKTPSDEQLFEALVKAYKGTPLSSREISDAAGISDPEVGRQAVRSAMKRLAEAGKVETVKAEKRRAAFLYKPKA
jgi:Fe2+ or Zn2+ uptake regulation protein